jgi:hypothetical protein
LEAPPLTSRDASALASSSWCLAKFSKVMSLKFNLLH